MVIELAKFQLAPGKTGAFLNAIDEAAPLLQGAPGYRGHSIGLGVEDPGTATLIVAWRSHADHVARFEPSEAHQALMDRLDGLYEGDVEVVHVDAEVPQPSVTRHA
ncbi:Heme-degrading monooxygenase HmoA [Palleronia marisminoris]|uniref:Antibiotic biosynthesis monooxygenase n=1 Tax=Palleronia marisminoris TaxID=315423 RepID=A0A1Y5TWW9_9RHOB|nr:antibiotic biosynthesis monooxygenase family protein [Palleronia marisminoris]SFH54660.1 Heme-degrading monooxygenase HmoA [Palleronia marisminoris]SLN71969.1 Antibiotic biosynthesis monooxygenase [Palleronia marisminoris]